MPNKESANNNIITKYLSLCKNHSFKVLSFYILITIAAVYSAMNLELVTDLGELLPDDTSSVLAIKESRSRMGSSDLYTIAIKSDDVIANVKMQQALKKSIEKEWKDAVWVEIAHDTSFFKQNALLYLEKKDLLDLRERIRAKVSKEMSKHNPALFSLDDEDDEEENSLANWYNPDRIKRLGLPSKISEKLENFFTGLDEEVETKSNKNPVIPKEYKDNLIQPDGKVAVVLVQLNRPSTDMKYAKEVLDRGESLIARLDPKKFAPDMISQVVGAYRSFLEVKSVSDDATKASFISLTLVLICLVLFFRNFSGIFIIAIPLIIGCIWTLGLTTLTYGRLTSLTAFVLAMLFGMGIDYGIHFYGRIRTNMQTGLGVTDAIMVAVTKTGTALLGAAITTIASLLTLLSAYFKGFYEFGVIASYGIAFCLISSVLIMPPFIYIIHRNNKKSSKSSENNEEKTSQSKFLNIVKYGGITALVVTVFLSFFIPNVQFEHDFRNLRGGGTKAKISYGKAVGGDKTTTPAIIMGKSEEQMRKVHDKLVKIRFDENEKMIKSFVTVATFVPSQEKQKIRMKQLKKIHKLLKKKALDKVNGKDKKIINELKEMSAVKTFTTNDIPPWSKRLLTERDGSYGKLGLIYGRLQEWDAYQVQEFQNRFGFIKVDNEQIRVASSGFILADVIKMVKRDGKRLGIWVGIVLFTILIVSLKSLKGALVCGIPMFIGCLWTVGWMGLIDLKVGMYNLIVIPTVLGVGIDGAIHIYHRYEELGSSGLKTMYKTTGVAIIAAGLTTFAGFTGLFFIEHKGLQTIAGLAAVGILSCLTAVMLLMPPILMYFKKSK